MGELGEVGDTGQRSWRSSTAPRRGRTAALVATAATAVVLLAAACTPTPGGTTTTTTLLTSTPTPPVVFSFGPVGPINTSPAIVTFAWSVGDANAEPLTCRIDGDGDGVDDVTITNCQTLNTTRNVSVALPPGATVASTMTARLTVEDGNSAPVTRTATYLLTPGPTEAFNITLRNVESLSPAAAAAFTAAAAHWEQVIMTGVPDYAGSLAACLPAGTAPITGPVDDVVIDVAVVSIDGEGEVLGQAGPDCINPSNELPVHGSIEFDSADVPSMLSDGTFSSVVLHEMAHVLGFGTLWDTTTFGGSRKVVQGIGGTNPRFSGVHAGAEWSRLGGTANVPVENGGGTGTAGSHWRDSVFQSELMTGYINLGPNPLSSITVASLSDLGYHVDLSAADPYTVPGLSWFARRSVPETVEGTMLRPPIAFA